VVASGQQDAAVSQGILALVQNFQAVPATPLLVAASQGGPPANGHSPHPVSTAALAEEELTPGNETSETIDCLVRPLVESATVGSSVDAPVQASEQVSEPVQDCSAVAPSLVPEAITPEPEPVETADNLSPIPASEQAPEPVQDCGAVAPPLAPETIPSVETADNVSPTPASEQAAEPLQDCSAVAPPLAPEPVETADNVSPTPASELAAEPLQDCSAVTPPLVPEAITPEPEPFEITDNISPTPASEQAAEPVQDCSAVAPPLTPETIPSVETADSVSPTPASEQAAEPVQDCSAVAPPLVPEANPSEPQPVETADNVSPTPASELAAEPVQDCCAVAPPLVPETIPSVETADNVSPTPASEQVSEPEQDCSAVAPPLTPETIPSVETADNVSPTPASEQSSEPVPDCYALAQALEQDTLVEATAQVEPSTPASKQTSEPVPDCYALAQALEQEAQIVLEAITPGPKPAEPVDNVSQALESQAQLVLDSISQQLETERAGISAILASFRERPTICLLGSPIKVVTPPAPPSLDWIRTPRPTIRAIAPHDPSIASLAAGPQVPTLNGPSLPPELRGLAEGTPSQQGKHQKRSALPAWTLSVLIATGLLLGTVSLVQYVSAKRDTQASAVSTQPGQASRVASLDSAVQEHPFARSVEVSGVRITAGLNHKPQLQYIVINHSSRELTGLGIRVALRSAGDPAGSAPLLTVFSKVPALGAYQSREIRTELDSDVRVSSLPDWQSLRPEVLVSGRQ